MGTPRFRSRSERRVGIAALLFAIAFCAGSPAMAEHIVLQSTTSTQNSGLFDHLLPAFTAASGVEVRVVAVGTGQALRNAAGGNGDVLMVHARSAEEQFISDGYGVTRHPVMYNEFILIGPQDDPAGIRDAGSAAEALTRIAAARAVFVTRGDDSGTHKRERALWAAAGVTPDPATDDWYKDTGSGMGRALGIAVELDAYILSDSGTWISYRNRGTHQPLFFGDPALFNQYSVILVNPERHPHVRAKAAQAFIDWILGPEGQALIGAYRLNGQALFSPNAGSDN